MFFLLALIPFSIASAQNCDLYKNDISEIKSCDNKKVHLTFDDGPNTTTTPKIVETLKRQNVKATFFISTHQLEKGDLKQKKLILNSMLDSGHTLSSHVHDHNCHDLRYVGDSLEVGYSDQQRRDQIGKSVSLLNSFTDGKFQKQKHTLLRFPYGRGISPSKKEIQTMIDEQGRRIIGASYAEKLKYYRLNSPAMSVASEFNLSHIGWNLDSKDASSTYSESNKDKYIQDQLKSICKSSVKNFMTLFHDTREINSLPSKYNTQKTVMDELIEKGKCLGIDFISMDQYLSGDFQDGIYTKDYSPISKVAQMSDQLNNITPANSGAVCSVEDTNNAISRSSGESCYSEYIGEVKHCQGDESICIDGTWIKNKNLAQLICSGPMSPSSGIELSQNYINKNCSTASERVEKDQLVACYCQNQKNDILQWNCFDISSGIAKAL